MGLVPRPAQDVQRLAAVGSSLNYGGNPYLAANISADIPDAENCNFWITGMPPSASCGTLLAAVRDTGRVFCTVINPPDSARGHPTSAGKLCFFDLAAAQRFYGRFGPGGSPFMVGGYWARVHRNRQRVGPSTETRFCSRVLVVSGPARDVSVDELLRLFGSRIAFQMEGITVTGSRPEGAESTRTVEFYFGSYRAQAQLAYSMLRGRPELRVTYGRDPCDAICVGP
ncbi:hypothetical protein BT67DRAFT_390279 [Trichocladium antarcticum]|uniref:Uncharacterized protein n=1 Tax=Trichocladium antarcticum TaxID=1450529 RepID=A0AAN6ZAK1_9PEZI|nr:hypothetical protein BT67DRAFT_390279 [Trichocladium antarcticum]